MPPTSTPSAVPALALFGALHATWSDIHPYCDQILQNPSDAIEKANRGRAAAMACVRHVATYNTGQTLAATAVTRLLGYRVPARAVLAGLAINVSTHYVIDRREPLIRVLRSRWIRKGPYLDHATVQRREDVIDTAGPGTALMEMDQAAHRLIGVAASLVTTYLAVRTTRP